MAKLKALRYYGGKSPLKATSRWIASLLPDGGTPYVEPFAGMAGILLSRKPAPLEIVNDLDGNLVAWWLCVRDRPRTVAWKIYHTPRSRQIFNAAVELLETDEGTQLQRAVALHIVIEQGMRHGPQPSRGSWAADYLNEARRPSLASVRRFTAALARRMHRVQIENKDAIEILERVADIPEAVVYCDPPYKDVHNSPYRHSVDVERLSEALLAQEGLVAVSGYNQDYDHLGWDRHERVKTFHRIGEHASKHRKNDQTRTEVLWTNYSPDDLVKDRDGDMFQ